MKEPRRPVITFISKHDMKRRFGQAYYGYAIPKLGMWVRDDLPKRVTTSVLAHETYHYNDTQFAKRSVWVRELCATWAGFQADWRGFFWAIGLSLINKERLILYWKRITQRF